MSASVSESTFERNKNLKALGYTIALLLLLFLCFFLLSWSIPVTPPPAADLGVEVNLGNSEQGLGTKPPAVPGAPTDAKETYTDPPPTAKAEAETQPDVAENKEADATPVNTLVKPATKRTKAPVNNEVKKTITKLVMQPAPPKPKPKALYAGGSSTNANSGNNSDSYNKSRNQGIAGSTGDQGKPNGNPNSDSYTGNGGTGSAGISITKGLQGRRIAGNARFQDEYKYGGKVSVDITVNEAGIVTGAHVKPGSPFADLNAIAEKRAMQLRFSKGDAEQSGTITIVFQNPKG